MKNLKLNSKKENNTIEKWMKDLNRHLTKEDIWVANENVKGSTSYAIREFQIKITIRCDYTLI